MFKKSLFYPTLRKIIGENLILMFKISDFIDLYPFLIFIYLTFNFYAGEYTKKFNFSKKMWEIYRKAQPKIKNSVLFQN